MEKLKITKVLKNDVKIHSCMSSLDGEMVCSVIVETKNKCTVLDVPLLRPHAKEFREYIEKLGKKIDRVIISHAHPDHWFGLEYFKDIPSYAFQETIDEIDQTGDAYIEFHHSMEGDLITNEKIIPKNVIKDNQLMIDGLKYNFLKIKDAEAKIMLAVDLPEIKTLLAQDLIYNNVFMYVGEKTSKEEECFDSWIENLNNLEKNNYDLVIPGHGEPTDSTIFKSMKDYLTTVKKEFSAAKDGEELKKRILEKYPSYRNPKMLDMSNNFLFGQ